MFHPRVNPHDLNIFLVNHDMSGAYITHDGGKSWRGTDGGRGLPLWNISWQRVALRSLARGRVENAGTHGRPRHNGLRNVPWFSTRPNELHADTLIQRCTSS